MNISTVLSTGIQWCWNARFIGRPIRITYSIIIEIMESRRLEMHTQKLFIADYNRYLTWCRHQMETFSALLGDCAGNSPVAGDFPAQRPVTRSFDIIFGLRLNKRLSKLWWGWWFETPSSPFISAETCGLDEMFPPGDFGSGPCTPFNIYIPHIITVFLLIKINSF